jgi:glycerophosphoryl diester phosphodiesterase
VTDIVSHRGGALLWPENSRIAFVNTTTLPVEQVEFDVHLSRDGALVVIHDAMLDRTTDGTGPVADMDWAALSGLVLRGTGGQRMLLLDEVIAIFRPTLIGLRLEIKPDARRRLYPGLPERIIDTLAACEMLQRTIVTSFQIDSISHATARGRPRGTIWLVTPDVQVDIGLAAVCDLAMQRGVSTLGVRSTMLNQVVVKIVREAGLGISAWACNDATTIARILALGVDSMTTDRPDLALKLRSTAARRPDSSPV